ncbi:hypothetical protein [Streptomyces sp. NPDC002763]|uniref:hypothetical protein n=1 Tax=Streptomyces sp. NPDC002763 TaxID=3154427 RepID=UPI00331C5B32
MPSHPQEVGENTVAEGHFPVIHKSPILKIRPYTFARPVLRGWIMPTVAGPWRIQLRFAACLRVPAPRWLPPRLGQPLAYAAARALCDIGLRTTAAGFVLNDDSPIWHTKRYQPADEQKGTHAASLPSDRQAPLLLPRTPRTPSAG